MCLGIVVGTERRFGDLNLLEEFTSDIRSVLDDLDLHSIPVCAQHPALRNFSYSASVFYAILVVLHQFLRGDARSASSSVPFARKSRKIDEKSRKS